MSTDPTTASTGRRAVLELSDSEAAILAAARAVLRSLGERARTADTFAAGKCHEALATAEDAVFDALNSLASHGEVVMTRAALFGHRGVENPEGQA